jgi:hypothetical protein
VPDSVHAVSSRDGSTIRVRSHVPLWGHVMSDEATLIVPLITVDEGTHTLSDAAMSLLLGISADEIAKIGAPMAWPAEWHEELTRRQLQAYRRTGSAEIPEALRFWATGDLGADIVTVGGEPFLVRPRFEAHVAETIVTAARRWGYETVHSADVEQLLVYVRMETDLICMDTDLSRQRDEQRRCAEMAAAIEALEALERVANGEVR